MDFLPLSHARELLDGAFYALPAAPTGWRGPAASACEQRLQDLAAHLVYLRSECERASALVAALEEAQLQCVVAR